ncbi:dephospho-CoA kinase [Nitrincola schmidtii]|uniref:dephospho-CoA kinase n=1 Tax=Nitrincola schmidtii TaxID=1730894 RepID=UPI00124E5B97|nr:dephospho-CoA kinase [Nitrincola schmidtii]
MRTIGLTGGIGSGKSAASRLFEKLGVPVIDADQVARDVVEPDQPALVEIQQHFGPEVITAKGELNRRWLRQYVFDHPKERQWLESLLHPLIRQNILNWLLTQQQHPYVLLTSPLLLETDQHQLVDAIIVVDVPETIQLQRTCDRDDMSPEAAQKIINTQIKRADRLARADFILDNSSDLHQLELQVIALDQQLRLTAGN